jgi:hypothetical protein
MRRIIFPAFLGLCILFLLPSKPGSAQQTEQKTEQKKMTPLKWVKLKDGVHMLRVGQLEAGEYPQISVLRVSNATYLKFFQDPEGFLNFVNENQVFPDRAEKVASWVSLSSYVPKDEADGWVLTCVHGKTTLMACSALTQLNQENPAPKTK